MAALVNIAKDNTKPLFIDPLAITAVDYNQAYDAVVLYTEKGQLLNIAAKAWNVDFADVVRKLRDNGATLVSFPTRWPAENDTFTETPHYIAPGAVTYATATKPDDTGAIRTYVGVKGVGRLESYNNTQGEFDTLLAAVQAEKTLLHYTPDVVTAGWSNNPAALYIDTNAVKQIHDNSASRLSLRFEQSAPLDLNTQRLNVNDVAKDIRRTMPAPSDLTVIFAEAERQKTEREDIARQNLAKDIADAHGGLTYIPVSDSFAYLRPEDVGFVGMYEDKGHRYLTLHMHRKEGQSFPDQHSLYYKTEAERQAAFNVLQSALGKAGPVVKPQLPKPGLA